MFFSLLLAFSLLVLLLNLNSLVFVFSLLLVVLLMLFNVFFKSSGSTNKFNDIYCLLSGCANFY